VKHASSPIREPLSLQSEAAAAPAAKIQTESVAPVPQTNLAIGAWPLAPVVRAEIAAYQLDVWERTILFWDTLRKRADNMIAHERAGKPPLLDFDYELILDARRFERPANYALLRITRYEDKCLEDCLDPAKPPVIIVDRGIEVPWL
jgi:hypothetical protein